METFITLCVLAIICLICLAFEVVDDEDVENLTEEMTEGKEI